MQKFMCVLKLLLLPPSFSVVMAGHEAFYSKKKKEGNIYH